MCAFVVEAAGSPGQRPADVLVVWTGRAPDHEWYIAPALGAPLAPFPTQPDAALDARGGVEVEAWPRFQGSPVILDTACAAGIPLP